MIIRSPSPTRPFAPKRNCLPTAIGKLRSIDSLPGSHFAEPELDPTSYQLTVKGSVARPFALELDELCSYETSELAVTLECAGNSRSFLSPAAAGLQFEHGATGTAAWTGVPLRILLDRAGVGENAREVLFRGADSGLEGGEHMQFERSLPLQRAMAGRHHRGLSDERGAANSRSRGSGPADRCRLVRDGFG